MLLRTDGAGQELTTGDPLFHATVSGLGLTGLIAWVEFRARQIPSAYLDGEDTSFTRVEDYLDIAAQKKNSFEHTMAWIDCSTKGAKLGRGIFLSASWGPYGDLAPHFEQPRRNAPPRRAGLHAQCTDGPRLQQRPP